MTALAATTLTLADWAKRLDPDGNTADVVELLSQDNQILEDMQWLEGNLPTGHQSTVRTGLPSATWRLLNYGVAASKSTTAQVVDTVGMLEAYSEVDRDLLLLNGNSLSFRMSEDSAFTQAMAQQFASTLFYGNTSVDPEKFLGLAPRYGLTTADNGINILNGGGTGSDNTSVWLIGWGDKSIHGIFPKGSQAGIQMRDLGEDTAVDSNGLKHQVFRTHVQQKGGLALKDWRYAVRIANIDTSELVKDATAGADLVGLMIRATERIKGLDGVRPAWYMNRTVSSFLRRQMLNKSSVAFISEDKVSGKKVMNFSEIPVRRVDAITNAEATVS